LAGWGKAISAEEDREGSTAVANGTGTIIHDNPEPIYGTYLPRKFKCNSAGDNLRFIFPRSAGSDYNDTPRARGI